MDSLPRIFSDLLESTFESIDDSLEQRLLLLSALGKMGMGANALFQDFRKCGILHLLVLSGAQVVYFEKSLKFFYWKLLAPCMGRCAWAGWQVFFWGALAVFGSAARWSAPLTRALLCSGFQSLGFGMRWPGAWGMALLIQAVLFPQHLLQAGFYLSWGASLYLKWARYWRWSNRLTLIGVIFLTQFLLSHLRSLPSPYWGQWVEFILGNFALAPLFENFLMQPLGILLCLTYVGSLVQVLEEMTGFHGGNVYSVLCWPLLAALRGGSSLVLVAVRAFRYI